VKSKTSIQKPAESTQTNAKQPRSLGVAERGIKTGNDFANLMSALMSDLLDGSVAPSFANAACSRHYKAVLSNLQKP
jgi:hypothetical protein